MSDTLDLENMSDEDFLNLEAAPAPEDGAEAAFVEEQATSLESQLDDTAAEEPEAEEATAEAEEATEEAADAFIGSDGSEAKQSEANPSTSQQDPEEAAAEAPAEAETPAQAEETPIDYKAAYDQIMAPFKANGREISLNSPDDVVRLMQMGANYTKKMQALSPNLKLMRMLENNNLLDEQKISFLIDLDKKNPQAIQKLLHDGKIDPMDLDASETPAYQPGNHAVSDQEMSFHTVLGEVSSTQAGQETLSVINSQWDQASKEAIFKEPEIMQIIDQQRSNGIYAKITAEMDRQIMLGSIPPNTPFIHAYRQVGDALHAQGLLAPANAAPPAGNPAPARRVVETRASQAKPAENNGDLARAAAPTRSSPAPAKQEFNPFTMTDEQIMAISSAKF